MSGWVYFVASVELGRVKIGYSSKNPVSRLKALQTGSPTELSLMCIQPGTRDDEQHLHRILEPFRLHGEWFEASDLVVYVMALVCRNAVAAHEDMGIEPPEWALAGVQETKDVVADVLRARETLQ
jgi:hypothetical protein